MKKRGISIAALAIACVFVVTIIVFGACVYSDYNSGLKAAGAKFEKLSSRAAEASGIYPSGSKEFINLFNSAVGSPDIFDSIKLEINGKNCYVYPMQESQQASVFTKAFSTRIVGGDGADIRLNATIYTVPPAMIFYRAKIAFIVILAGTLAAGILLMYLYLCSSESDSENADVEFKNTSVKDDFGESLFDEGGSEQAQETDAQDSESAASAPADEQAQADVADDSSPKPELGDDAQKVDYNPLENAYADQQSEMANGADAQDAGAASQAAQQGGQGDSFAAGPSSDEQGLFSPASGFGWESYLEARLESELVRAASSEQDLSLAIIQIPGMTKESDYYGNVCQAMLDFFQYRDFIFEYKDNGFATIIQNKDVDEAMQSAEVLHSNLKGTLSSAGQNETPLMGLSSRSLRLISAERLKNEAEQALLHAGDDKNSPIIAFRVNPEKYRKFIGEQKEE